MSNSSTFPVKHRQTSFRLAASVIVIIASAPVALSKPTEQVGSDQLGRRTLVVSLSSPEPNVTDRSKLRDEGQQSEAQPRLHEDGSTWVIEQIQQDCGDAANSTACQSGDWSLPVRNLQFGGPR